MTARSIAERRALHAKLSVRIAEMGDDEIGALLDAGESSAGWGRNQTVEIRGHDVFVKRVPVTELEMRHGHSTRNLYELALFYQYGVGSAGFGVWRELAMHVKTTEWVLAGEIANFPLMYHHRTMPQMSALTPMSDDRLDGYVKYWGGSESLRRYWRDREQARHEVVIFLELFPHTVQGWLMKHQGRVPEIVEQLRETVDFLRAHGVIHFDAHFNNVVTDGDRAYLTDFGLALDRGFELSEGEEAFFERHTHYDYGEVLWNVGYMLQVMLNALSDEEKVAVKAMIGMAEAGPLADPFVPLVDHVEDLAADSRLGLHPTLVETIVRYREVIKLVQGFFVSLRANLRKDTQYPYAELRRLLRETGFAD
jgi:hypothetical protein